ncbi:pimeloyl-ACP methyl ester esterase BioH [Ectothiorhodospira marina]|uniref:Pimeloyl-[acyl-carrier protein] methyl ester esterase n=1 Tax=Ectothiorhodospira marina TaxID=1396821 RepID=A0A1H7R942_9GAMM|nr:pimeloyl-ACP methyl ester esterase BioH [Ectothiorhodospira marina]SEL56508.1 pimeloyl-[acyl-carrier protein] methyl ester esterase [Ectothiorhodospira marina]
MKKKLMLIHGWGLNAGVWDDLIPALRDEARVLAVDLPGHGRLAGEGGLGELDDAADRLVDTSSIPQADSPESDALTLVGWSLGALVAIRAATRHPGRVGKVILVAGTPRFVQGPDWPHAMRVPVLDAFAQGLAANYRTTLNRFLALQFHGLDNAQDTLRGLRARLLDSPPAEQALHEGLVWLRHLDLRDELAALDCPVHAILGEYDTLVPPGVGESLRALRPDMKTPVIERAGHAPFLSRPDAFEETLRSLLHD